MTELEPVQQIFLALTAEYVAAVDAATAAAARFAEAATAATDAVDGLQAAVDDFSAAAMIASLTEAGAAAERESAAARDAAASTMALQGAIDALHGKDVTVGVDASTASAAAAAAAVDQLAGAEWKANAAGQLLIDISRSVAESEAMEATAVQAVTDALEAQARAAGLLAAESALAAGASDASAAAMTRLDRTASASGDAAARATPRWYGLWGILSRISSARVGLFGGVLGAVSGIHLLVDGFAELLAVVVPAGIALAAFGVAAAPTLQDIYGAMKSVLTVTTATSQSLYPMTGQFQAMAAAVKPQVYQLFGDVLNIAAHNSGEFTRLARGAGAVLDQLGARFEAALTSGSGFSVFLAHAVTDLGKLGDIAGNVFGVLGNLLRTVPGYAQYMLNFADGVTKVAEAFTGSGLVQGVLKFGLASHGAVVYTGLLATGAARLLTGIGRFPGLLSLASDWLGRGALAAEKLAGEGNLATRAMGNLSSKLSLAQGLPWGWITLGAALAGVLAYKFVTARDAADSFIASFNTNLGAAPLAKVTTDISGGLEVMSARMASAKAQMDQFSGAGLAAGRALAPIAPGLQDAGNWFTRLNDSINGSINSLIGFNLLSTDNAQGMRNSAAGAAVAVHDYQAYKNEVGLLTQQSVTFHSRLGQLAVAFGGTAQAMGILNAAGITSSQMLDRSGKAWVRIVTQVNATISAYRAMGQQGGILGADMNAMTLAGSDQVQAMTRLNSAWDTTIGIVSGGQGTFIAFEQALHAGASSIAGVASMAKVAGASMSGMNTQSLALRSAWQGAYTNGSKVVDALRMMISVSPHAAAQNRNLSQSVKDVVAQLMAQGRRSSATRAELVSLAQEVNPNIRNFSELTTWLGHTGNAGRDLGRRLAGLGVNIADVTRDAGRLAGVMGQQITSQFSAAKLAANGTDQAIQSLASTIGHGGDAAAQQAGKLTLFHDLVYKDGYTASQAASLISALTGAIFRIPRAHHTELTTNAAAKLREIDSLQRAIDAMHGKTIAINVIYSSGGVGGAGGATPGVKQPGAASGATAAAQGPLLVGERGPELMYMHGGESVTPAPQTAGILAALASASAAGGGGERDIVLHLSLQMPPPGEQRASTQQYVLRYGKRNGRSGLDLPIR